MIGLAILGGLLLALVAYVMMTYNGLITLKNRVKNAWSQIEVQLKRRYDLIPNLVETVKGYMKHEQETLEKVIRARNMAIGAQGAQAQAQAENMLTGALKSLFALSENYPDLKANQNVMSLQEELTTTENKIAFARQFYNDITTTYNTKIQLFPANIIASMFQFREEELFDAPEEVNAVPKVSFS